MIHIITDVFNSMTAYRRFCWYRAALKCFYLVCGEPQTAEDVMHDMKGASLCRASRLHGTKRL